MAPRKPNFIEYEDGGISKVFCKVCGTQIAGRVEAPAGSGPRAGKLVEKFKRFASYAEAKFKCDDGSFHVTHACAECLKAGLSNETMAEMHKADMAEMGVDAKNKPVELVTVDTSHQGII